MTQETEIPEDVLNTVNELWHERLHSAHANDGLGSGEIMSALAVAILAERERCAQIAGSKGNEFEFDMQFDRHEVDGLGQKANVAFGIASAIRSGS